MHIVMIGVLEPSSTERDGTGRDGTGGYGTVRAYVGHGVLRFLQKNIWRDHAGHAC